MADSEVRYWALQQSFCNSIFCKVQKYSMNFPFLFSLAGSPRSITVYGHEFFGYRNTKQNRNQQSTDQSRKIIDLFHGNNLISSE
jgi:hypothetical protein